MVRSTPFRERLEAEFKARRAKNGRYSLRAFAAFLGTDHSSLSQMLRSTRPIPARRIRSWGSKLALLPEETAVYIAAEHVPDEAANQRQDHLRHWTAEAMAIVTDQTHWKLLAVARSAGFRPDCRWIAKEIGCTVDAVNVALSRLLRLRLLEITKSGEWTDLTGMAQLKPEAFQRLALVKVRERAAEDGIKFHGRAHR
jgi:hypothetical protein